MFKVILVGTDGSDRAARAVAQAAELAKICGAKLHVVSAYKGVETAMAGAMAAGAVAAMGSELNAAAEEEAKAVNDSLEQQVGAIRGTGVDVTCHAVQGSAVPVLLDLASEVGADLIVTGNRGMTGAKRLLGSVPNTLAHNAECAVLIVQTDD
jgi:nucleotide-binding universal stress UspA family protein